jgi:signal transduction histidine kinase
MEAVATTTSTLDADQRMEELGRIILAYSEVTEKLQQSQERLEKTVARLRAEVSEKNKIIERKNRLAALGEMAAGIAHEIRNPLGGIQLYASLLKRDVADRPAALDVVNKISGGVRRLEGLVSQVLQFSREIRCQLHEANLADVVDEVVDLARGATDARAVVELNGPRPMTVNVDDRLLGQAVLNLILNAVEAGSGRVTVSWHRPTKDEAKQFVLRVEDDGPGIAPDVMDRIFNPFFTTRDEGTGLGLSIVHRIVEAHDGAIGAGNRECGGARFEIRI